MPPGDAFLAEFPAQVHHLAVTLAREVEEPLVGILEFNAMLIDRREVLVHLVDESLGPAPYRRKLVSVLHVTVTCRLRDGAGELLAQFVDLALALLHGDDVIAYLRERRLCLVQRE